MLSAGIKERTGYLIVMELLFQLLAEESFSCWLQKHCLKIWRRKELTLRFVVGQDNEGMSRSLLASSAVLISCLKHAGSKPPRDHDRVPLYSAMCTAMSGWDEQKSMQCM